MGELHLEIIHDRLKRDYKIDCSLGKLQVAYREAPSVEVMRKGNIFIVICDTASVVIVMLNWHFTFILLLVHLL